jgi:tetratricopeptide (TPR) repeat protein
MRTGWKILLLIVAVAASAAAVFLSWYFNPVSRSGRLTREAIEAGKSGNLKGAQALLENAVKLNPSNFLARFNLGMVYGAQDFNEKAFKEFLSADSLVPGDALTSLELARINARLDRKDDALAALERAIDLGFSNIVLLNNDDDFAGLHGNPRFQALYSRWDERRSVRDGGTDRS